MRRIFNHKRVLISTLKTTQMVNRFHKTKVDIFLISFYYLLNLMFKLIFYYQNLSVTVQRLEEKEWDGLVSLCCFSSHP